MGLHIVLDIWICMWCCVSSTFLLDDASFLNTCVHSKFVCLQVVHVGSLRQPWWLPMIAWFQHHENLSQRTGCSSWYMSLEWVLGLCFTITSVGPDLQVGISISIVQVCTGCYLFTEHHSFDGSGILVTEISSCVVCNPAYLGPCETVVLLVLKALDYHQTKLF